MARTYRIYKIDCPDGRSYIGCTTNAIELRLEQHFASGRRGGDERHNVEGIGAAVYRFGIDAVRIVELSTAKDAQVAAEIETALIAQHGTMAPHGYNMRAASCIKRGVAKGAGISLQRKRAA
jgi:predicted GIY-YIG superfamily endonuclease